MMLVDFILKAKLSGYASRGEGQERSFDDGSVGFEVAADGFTYVDRYHGFNPFAGSEHVFGSGSGLLWVMHYFGEILPSGSDARSIYAFLREAMLLISTDYPFRGPAELINGNMRYENQQAGSLDRFHGIERIFEGSENVYVLYYHGGMIQKAG